MIHTLMRTGFGAKYGMQMKNAVHIWDVKSMAL